MSSSEREMHPATKLGEWINDSEKIVLPGAFDGFSARLTLRVRFDAMYMVSSGYFPAKKAKFHFTSQAFIWPRCSEGLDVSASHLGRADIGIASLADMRAHAEMIANLDPTAPPDSGYEYRIWRLDNDHPQCGGVHQIRGIWIPHRGSSPVKALVSLDEYLTRIRSAVHVREKHHSDIVIIACTDALQSFGYDDAIKRLKAARNAGADVGFFEGIMSKEMAA
ncbi:MAG: hypothetical protein M1834_005990 [Cirrosporium novae-zelandiae]|nr:MAG: hypothetical protein M1834_005990 [Cirrosporium novae-zelandiae]